MKHKKTIAACFALVTLAGGCSDAEVASRNLSRAAENFEIQRRVVFYNGITGEYILTIEGLCNKDVNHDSGSERKLSIVCLTGPNEYKKHLLGLSDNVTYFIEQVDSVNVDVYHYRVFFKPSVIIPNIDMK
jgi:hypothetical protein